MTTSTLIAEIVRQPEQIKDLIEVARSLAAPAALFLVQDRLQLWNVASDTERLISNDPVEEEDLALGRLQSLLDPETLLAAKRGTRQLPLFPVDVRLISRARQNSGDALADRIEDAVRLCLPKSLPAKQSSQRQALKEASRLTVGALGILMVRDKLLDGSANPLQSIELAQQRFPGYFNWISEHDSADTRLVETVSLLGEGVSYESLDPAVVSQVYEQAVVSESDRLKLGIYYTPPEIALRITKTIPFEEINPEDRYVLDPACGSGTLLLAVHERMRNLVPAGTDLQNAHEYLVKHVRGYDIDPFAVEIARLALLINALPAGNSWSIEEENILKLREVTPHPSVIVSNPPWKDIRSRKGIRHQQADDFVAAMLRFVRPEGFLAVILPTGWLSGKTSETLREMLRARANTFEVWRLTEEVFHGSAMAPCVLIAQASAPNDSHFIFRRVLDRPRSLDTFLDTGVADEQYLSRPSDAMVDPLLRGPLNGFDYLRDLPKLSDVATVQDGPVPEPPVQERGGTGDFLWLSKAGELRPFAGIQSEALIPIKFPQEFHRAGKHDGTVFRRSKLLVTARRAPDMPWRLKVGMDQVGVIPRESLYMVIPSDEVDEEGTLHALLCILGSSFASCWIDSYEPKRSINANLLRSLPLPPKESWDSLSELGHIILDHAASGELPLALMRKLEKETLDAYQAPAELRRRIASHFAGFQAPEGHVRYASTPTPTLRASDVDDGRRTFGSVLEVKADRLLLWVPGVTPDKGAWVDLPPAFLGRHARKGATFEIELAGEDLHSAFYYFQRRSYMSDEELSVLASSGSKH